MFEPVHGSAPDIAGTGVSNPLATVLCASLMLDDIGEPEAAEHLYDLVAAQLAEGDAPRTPDLGGDATTTDVVEDLRRRI
jgi:tartrate dehydrogenase/decarboxylase/D-malate dehydrogenase